jgi:hypothetical protein
MASCCSLVSALVTCSIVPNISSKYTARRRDSWRARLGSRVRRLKVRCERPNMLAARPGRRLRQKIVRPRLRYEVTAPSLGRLLPACDTGMCHKAALATGSGADYCDISTSWRFRGCPSWTSIELNAPFLPPAIRADDSSRACRMTCESVSRDRGLCFENTSFAPMGFRQQIIYMRRCILCAELTSAAHYRIIRLVVPNSLEMERIAAE